MTIQAFLMSGFFSRLCDFFMHLFITKGSDFLFMPFLLLSLRKRKPQREKFATVCLWLKTHNRSKAM